MQVTLMTDASVCFKTHIGAYGFWVASNRSKQPGSGVFVEDTNDSNTAEMRAVVYSLATCINTGSIQKNDVILIQLDNDTAIRILSGLAVPDDRIRSRKQRLKYINKKEVSEILNNFKNLVNIYELTINFRHVKGHTAKRDLRSLSNNHCDARAKLALNAARRLHELKEKNQ